MKNIMVKIWVFLTVISLLCGHLQARGLNKKGEPVNGLKLILSADKEVIKIGAVEPLKRRAVSYSPDSSARLSITFVNTQKKKELVYQENTVRDGDEKGKIHKGKINLDDVIEIGEWKEGEVQVDKARGIIQLFTYDMIWSRLTLNVNGPDEESVRILRRMVEREMVAPDEKSFVEVKPGEVYEYPYNSHFPGYFGSNTFTLLKPGKYTLSVTYNFPRKTLEIYLKGKRKELYKGTWAGTVKSNEIAVDVSGFFPKLEAKLKTIFRVIPRTWDVKEKTQIILCLEVRNRGTKTVRLLPISPSMIIIRDSDGQLVPIDCQGRDRTLRLNIANYPLCRPGAASTMTMQARLSNGRLHMSDVTGSFWASRNQLKPGKYSIQIIYANDKEKNGLTDNLWTGSIRTNKRKITIQGKIPKAAEVDTIF